jgi:thiamine biosynthesis lipoprotein ApbE
LITPLNNIALLHCRLKQPAEAAALFERSLRIAEATLGPNHPTVGRVLNNYSKALRMMKRKAEAETAAARAKSILDGSLRSGYLRHTVDLSDLALEAK